MSPDTIIPLPWNPQSFNRYTYVLNNPLKYVDPSGRIVSIAGIGDINNLSLEDWAYLMQMTPEARNKVLAVLEGYNVVQKEAPTETKILEGSDKTYTIWWGDSQLPSSFNVDTRDITISTQADSYYIQYQILGNVYDAADASFFPDLSDFPTSDQAIIAYDYAAVAGDVTSFASFFSPGVGAFGYWSSNVAAVNGFLETWNRYNTGRASGWDLVVSGTTTVLGFIPYFGLGASGFQLWWDIYH